VGKPASPKENSMNSSEIKQDKEATGKPRPLKEKLWNLFGILFYITMAVGVIYHLIPVFTP
jgi:hypothetical protein